MATSAEYQRTYRRRDPEGRRISDATYMRRRRAARPDVRAWQVEYTRQRRLWAYRWVAGYKLMVGCADCGYRAHHEALDCDHRPGTVKRFNVGRGLYGHGPATIWAEIQKCDVVCAICHRIRTAERRVN